MKINLAKIRASLVKMAIVLVAVGILRPFFFATGTSLGRSVRGNLPPGDYIVDSLTGEPRPFFPDQSSKMTDSTECGNSSGIKKILKELGFIETALMGEDHRCDLSYEVDAPEEEKDLYGVGAFFAVGGPCKISDTKVCNGAGHLVIDQDLVVTAAHIFQNMETHEPVDFKDFRYVAKVFIPMKFRIDPRIAYEPRIYEIESVHFGRRDAHTSDPKDYAFVKLKERVGEFIGAGIDSSRQSKRTRVDESNWIRPLPFRKLSDKERFGKPAMTVGTHFDKADIQKNCEPNWLFKHPDKAGMVAFDGDMLGGSSGSSISVRDEDNILTFAAMFTGDSIPYSATEYSGDFDLRYRYNYGIDGNEIYDEFMLYRKKKLKRTSLTPIWLTKDKCPKCI